MVYCDSGLVKVLTLMTFSDLYYDYLLAYFSVFSAYVIDFNCIFSFTLAVFGRILCYKLDMSQPR